mmetsp:Transcript_19407/g.23204  ORF Transcript_19407/g.23204 Transcript_19407/m.23204 type:complete len:97 (-) Transcript_19407:95-385(-)
MVLMNPLMSFKPYVFNFLCQCNINSCLPLLLLLTMQTQCCPFNQTYSTCNIDEHLQATPLPFVFIPSIPPMSHLVTSVPATSSSPPSVLHHSRLIL